MKNKSVFVIGAFGYQNHLLDGQTVKTRSVYNLVKKKWKYGVNYFDTQEKGSYIKRLISSLKKLISCSTVIMLPASNSLSYAFPIVYYLSKIFKYKIILICIGGWQVEYFNGDGEFDKKHLYQLRLCKKIHAFFPELKKVCNDLIENYQFSNVVYFPNFREFTNTNIEVNKSTQLRLVFLARMNQKKGYDIIFSFANYIQQNNLNIIIDLYGRISPEYENDFLSKICNYKVVQYKGVLSPINIQSVLFHYDLMLFPTRFYTEGIPGTIIDAYIAGLPVIATEWKHAREIIKDEKTGFIIPFENPQEEFDSKILELYYNREKLQIMKMYALQESHFYSEDYAWDILSRYL